VSSRPASDDDALPSSGAWWKWGTRDVALHQRSVRTIISTDVTESRHRPTRTTPRHDSGNVDVAQRGFPPPPTITARKARISTSTASDSASRGRAAVCEVRDADVAAHEIARAGAQEDDYT